jgi:hypothetical protein
MITVEADFNHRDGAGRLILADLVMHRRTSFAEIAAAGERILFVDGEDIVEGTLTENEQGGWLGEPDWSTQDVLHAYPEKSRSIV